MPPGAVRRPLGSVGPGHDKHRPHRAEGVRRGQTSRATRSWGLRCATSVRGTVRRRGGGPGSCHPTICRSESSGGDLTDVGRGFQLGAWRPPKRPTGPSSAPVRGSGGQPRKVSARRQGRRTRSHRLSLSSMARLSLDRSQFSSRAAGAGAFLRLLLNMRRACFITALALLSAGLVSPLGPTTVPSVLLISISYLFKSLCRFVCLSLCMSNQGVYVRLHLFNCRYALIDLSDSIIGFDCRINQLIKVVAVS